MDGVHTDLATLERETRRMEGLLESKLASYTQLGMQDQRLIDSGFADDTEDTVDYELLAQTESEIERLLAQLSSLLDELGSNAEGGAIHSVQYHRAHLQSCASEYREAFKRHVQARERRELFSGAEKDRMGGSGDPDVDEIARERAAISESKNSAGVAIETGYATAASLNRQRRTLEGSRSRMESTDVLTSVQSLLGSIQRRKFKNNLIIAFAIALCIFLFIGYMMRKIF